MSHTSERRLTVSDAYRLYYLEHSFHLRDSTRKTMECYFRTWESMADSPDVGEITTEMFLDVKKQLADSGISAASINSMIRSVVTILRHCGPKQPGCPHGMGIIREVPYPGRKLRENRKPKWSPKRDELSAMYVNCDVARWPKLHVPPGVFWRCWLVAAYNTGLRRNDLFSLLWCDVDFDDRTLIVEAQKTGKPQAIPINDTLEKHLLMMQSDSDRVFPVAKCNHLVARELTRISEVANVRRLTPQALRRAAGTAFEIKKGGAGQLLLGHACRGVTFTSYVETCEILRPVAEAIEQPEAFIKADTSWKRPVVVRKPVAKPVPITDKRHWRFPDGENRFIFHGSVYNMQGRALALLALLVDSKHAIDFGEIRESVYADFPDVTDNTIKGQIAFLRTRLRELFGLPDWFNAIPGRNGGWFLALPEITPEVETATAPAKHSLGKFRKSDWKIKGRRISYRGSTFSATHELARVMRKFIEDSGTTRIRSDEAFRLRRLLRESLNIPESHNPVGFLSTGQYFLEMPANLV